jgi:hypothetical protein
MKLETAPRVREIFSSRASRESNRPLSRRHLRLLEAFALASATTRLLNDDSLRRKSKSLLGFVARISNRLTMAALPTDIEDADPDLESDPRWHAVFSEMPLFERAGFRVNWCGQGMHEYVGPPGREHCPAHAAAGLKATQRRRHVLFIKMCALLESGSWKGTASQLLRELRDYVDSKSNTPRKLTKTVRRFLPQLRRAGIDVAFCSDALEAGQVIEIKPVPKS